MGERILRSRYYLVLSFLLCNSAFAAGPMLQEEAEAEEPLVKAAAEAVLLDLVVRTGDGRPVTDLRPEEVEILENGVPQPIVSMEFHGTGGIELLGPGGREGAAAVGRISPEDGSLRLANLVTLVFDNLGTEPAALARRAAFDFIDRYAGPRTWISVFNVSRRLIVLQEFTRDPEALKRAVEEATSQAPMKYYGKSDEIYRRLQEITELEEAAGLTAEPGGSEGAASGELLAQAHIARLVVNMMQFAQSLEMDESARSTLYSLLSLIQGQGLLEGRKTLVYFSEGLRVTPSVDALYQTLISEANRNNVSVYAVDARGLRAGGELTEAKEALEAAVEASRRQQMRSGGAVQRDEAMLTDRQDEIGRMNVQAKLADLAASTGGFLLANTNDYSPGMAKISEDIYAHYEIAYTPREVKYDGTFRRIEVRLKRPGLTVQSRSGYFALPPTRGVALLPFEQAMLGVLAQDTLPQDLSFRAGVLRFDPGRTRVRHKIVLQLPLADLSFREEKQGKEKQYAADFAMLALVKDAGGVVVEKVSQAYPVRGPSKNLEKVKRGEAVLIRDIRLLPGRYSVDAVAQDQGAGKFAAERFSFEVPGRKGVALSSVVVVKRTEELAKEEQDLGDPLQFQGLRLVPALGEPVLKTADNRLMLYLVVYPHPDVPYEPQLGLEFSQNGVVVGATQPQLPERDEQGNIPFVIRFPLDYFQPGTYQVRAVAQQGDTVAESVAEFVVALP